VIGVVDVGDDLLGAARAALRLAPIARSGWNIARTFQTNVMAPMALTRDLMPLLVAAKPSRVVNVDSIFGS